MPTVTPRTRFSLTAVDEDDAFDAGNTVDVTVHNVAPTLAISGASDVNEGSSLHAQSVVVRSGRRHDQPMDDQLGRHDRSRERQSVERHAHVRGRRRQLHDLSRRPPTKMAHLPLATRWRDRPQRGADAGDQRRIGRERRVNLYAQSVVDRSGHGHDHAVDDQLGRRHASCERQPSSVSHTYADGNATTTRSVPRRPTRTAHSPRATRWR